MRERFILLGRHQQPHLGSRITIQVAPTIQKTPFLYFPLNYWLVNRDPYKWFMKYSPYYNWVG